ncbi:MAG TPA: 3'-5' exonuclease [Vicinamibacterales bacterium]|nr:3'-5' exonuclease [Vicinamibacterales bacterium]
MASDGVTTAGFLSRYRESFRSTWSDHTPIGDVRFVVLDSETTGLDPTTDRIITIGAVAVVAESIELGDAFQALIRISENTPAAAVHGVTRDESRHGVDEPQALEAFLGYLRDGVIVGHHIGHDVRAFNATLQRHWGLELSNRSLDTMDLTLQLERDGAFAGRPPIRGYTLDALCEMFGVVPHGRHTATGDAFITAQIFLRLLRLAGKCGRTSLQALCEPFVDVEPPG